MPNGDHLDSAPYDVTVRVRVPAIHSTDAVDKIRQVLERASPFGRGHVSIIEITAVSLVSEDGGDGE